MAPALAKTIYTALTASASAICAVWAVLIVINISGVLEWMQWDQRPGRHYLQKECAGCLRFSKRDSRLYVMIGILLSVRHFSVVRNS